jgi:hypothetical protein
MQLKDISVSEPHRGHPVKHFTECSSKIKKRKVQELWELSSLEEIFFLKGFKKHTIKTLKDAVYMSDAFVCLRKFPKK